MTLLGELALWLALPMAVWASAASFAGASLRRDELAASGRRALRVAFAALVLAAFALAWALVKRDVSIAYVASHVTGNLPTPFALAALWSGGAGSLLLTAVFLALAGVIASARSTPTGPGHQMRVTGAIAAALSTIVAVVAFSSHPFAREAWLPPDGRGMNPQLQHPAMFVHPLLLLAGGAITVVPFAQGVAASLARTPDTAWLSSVRRWALLAWLTLGAGIALGMRWAYAELGWGGVWRWDPVQNAALLTWLALAAALHASAVSLWHGVLRRWTSALAMAPFVCALFASWTARSDLLPSVHAFARTPDGIWMTAIVAAAAMLVVYLAIRGRSGASRGALEPIAAASRESAAFAGSAMLATIGFVVLWGTLYPLLAEWVSGERVTVGAPYFATVLTPLTALALAAMSAGAALAWRGGSRSDAWWRLLFVFAVAASVAAVLAIAGVRLVGVVVSVSLAAAVLAGAAVELAAMLRRHGVGADGATASMRRVARARAVGAFVAHAGVAVVVIGLAGLPFASQRVATLEPGDALEAADPFGDGWRFVSQGVSLYDAGNQRVAAVALDVWRGQRRVGLMRTSKRQSVDAQGNDVFEPQTEVAVLSSPALDALVALVSLERETATIRVWFRPMTFWIWIGAALVVGGGIVSLLAGARLVPERA